MEIRKAAEAAGAGAPTQEQLAAVNLQAKTPLTAEQVYVFSVRLCDDAVDRDFERFDTGALAPLGALFVGKTGIVDHEWSANGQLARIFACETEKDGATTFLRAWAYMLRGEKTAPIIAEIEGGIRREVSVGCSMGKSVCSICGAPYGSCEHRKGVLYGKELCTAILQEPLDAYEFSFVAVPAQREAGVLKRWTGEMNLEEKTDEVRKQLEQEAAAGRRYLESMRQEAVRLGLVLDGGADRGLLQSVVEKLACGELEQVCAALRRRAAKLLPMKRQLGTPQEHSGAADDAFRI